MTNPYCSKVVIICIFWYYCFSTSSLR